MPLTIPDLIRDGSQVDNDSLLILGMSLVVYLLARVVTGDFSLRTGALIAISMAVALWTKGFALVLPAAVLLAYLVGVWRQRHDHPGIVGLTWRPLVAAGLGGLVGSAWWVRNLVDYGRVQTNGFGSKYTLVIYGQPDRHGTLERFLPPFLNEFLSNVWGEIGIPSSPSLAPFLEWGWLALTLIGTVAALAVRDRPLARSRMATLGFVPAAIVALVAYGSYSSFKLWSNDIHSAQGRYVYPGIVAIAALFAVGWSHLIRPRFHARLIFLVVIGALVTNGSAWILILRDWYQKHSDRTYLGGTVSALGALVRWSPVPAGITVVAVVIVPIAAAIWCVRCTASDARAWAEAAASGRAPGTSPRAVRAPRTPRPLRPAPTPAADRLALNGSAGPRPAPVSPGPEPLVDDTIPNPVVRLPQEPAG